MLQIFLKVDKFATFSERPKAKSFLALGWLQPRESLTRGSAPGPRWGLRPHTPYYRDLTLVFGGPPTL